MQYGYCEIEESVSGCHFQARFVLAVGDDQSLEDGLESLLATDWRGGSVLSEDGGVLEFGEITVTDWSVAALIAVEAQVMGRFLPVINSQGEPVAL